MAEDIAQWLNKLGLGQYAQAFAENGIDTEALPYLRDEDFERLGVLLGHMRRLQAAIGTLSADESPTRPVPTRSQEPEFRPAEAERRQLTVMFCDLVGSTALSQRLDPEELREVMRRYQDTVAGLVARFEGHVAKFLGDGVLAFFGWPRAYEDQAERAVRSGMAAVDAVANLKTEDGQALAARVGIATGQVVIGDIVGEAATEEDAVTGETPNLAARLLEVASPGQVVIGATTRLLIGDALDLEDIGTHQLKGFAEPVAAWRVLGESTAETRFEAVHSGRLTQFVGREHELGLLKRAWQQSKAGVGQVVLISGEPGIGKSRLVDALGPGLKAEGCTRITLGCSPYHTNSALYPVIVHLERVLGWQDQDNAEVKLAKLEGALQGFSLAKDEAIPLFAALLSLPLAEDRYPPLNFTPQQQKQRTLDATVAWLLEEAERRPVLQVWEDLHWADPSTLELLALEIEQAPTAPILNVLTFRPEFASPWPQRSHMTPLTLNRLERPEVEALITQQAGGKALPQEVVEYIVNRTDGVPLFVEELTKAILEADFLLARNGRYELTGPLSEITIPATLQDSLMARLDRLPTIREVAQLGAVLGREFTYEMLQAVASLDETTLQNGLDQLVEDELLYQRGRPPRTKYIFKHALVQDAAYESMLRSTRRAIHARIAKALQEHFSDRVESEPEVLAHHFTEAGLPAKAVAYWLKAGQWARRRSADVEAIEHLTQGLKSVDDLTDQSDRRRLELDLQVTLAQAFFALKGYGSPETKKAFLRAYELTEAIGDKKRQFEVLYGLYAVHYFQAEHEKGLKFASESLRLAEPTGDSGALCIAHRSVAVMHNAMGRFVEARKHARKVVELYDLEQHQHLAVEFGHDVGVPGFGHLSYALWHLGYPDQASHMVREALNLAERTGHPNTLVYCHFFPGAMSAAFARDMEALETHAQALTTKSKELGLAQWEALGTVLLGPPITSRSKAAEGVAQMERGLALCRSIGIGICRPLFLGYLAEGHAKTGKWNTAITTIDEALALVDTTQERWSEPELWRIKGELLSSSSARSQENAEHCLRRAIDVARQQRAKSPELRAATSLSRILYGQGQCAEASDLLAPVYDWFTEGFDTSDLKDAKLLLDELASK